MQWLPALAFVLFSLPFTAGAQTPGDESQKPGSPEFQESHTQICTSRLTLTANSRWNTFCLRIGKSIGPYQMAQRLHKYEVWGEAAIEMRSAELFAKALLIWPGPDVPKVNVAPEPIERFCRGDWGAPKSDASNTTIAVNRCAIERIHHLKLLVVELKAGHAIRKYRVVKSDKPDDLVFQSVQSGKPLRDNNVLSRFIKPAARNMGLPWVNV